MTHTTDVVVSETTTPTTIADLIRVALEHGADVGALERLQALHERVSDRMAAAEFSAALHEFQQDIPPITTSRTANIATRSGGTYSYRYAELDHLVRVIRPCLYTHGLSYTWDSEVTDGTLRCVCTLRHVNGHQTAAAFTCPTTSASGMNDQQKVAAALTFARRQSLIQVLGLTTTDTDTDTADPATITEDQVQDLAVLLDEKGADGGRFLKWARVARLEDIRAADYDAIVRMIQRKKGAA
jgi:hypothetical protein